jgi:hypothetical protein
MRNAIVAALLIAGGIALGATAASTPSTQESRFQAHDAIVTYIEEDSDTVTFTDEDGELWDLDGIEDWMLGDNAHLVTDNRGTPELYDDVVLSATYYR